MTQNQIKIQYLIKRYRYRHKEDPRALEMLEHILWHSYPIVYLDYEISQRQAQRAVNARKASKRRVNKYIKNMSVCYDACYFVTLTFTDSVLESANERTRHRYVTRWLFENAHDYIGNVDYGHQNNREHYHAVVAFKSSDELVQWPYGFMNVKLIGSTAPCLSDGAHAQRLSGYILKLSNHAGKEKAGRIFHAKNGFKDVDNLPF